MLASELGNVEIVRILAEKESKIQNFVGLSALMMAAKCGRVESVRVLCDFERGL